VSGAPHKPQHQAAEEPPPILGAWRRIYWFVLAYLALLILALYFFSRAFAA
jgi:hypothetical protein